MGYDNNDQEEVYLNSWRGIDETIFVEQITGLNNRIREVATRFTFVVEENDYDKTWKKYYDLMTKDLASNGWIHTFYQLNKSDFPANGSKPEWYSTLTDKERYQYDSVYKYFEYMAKVDKASYALYNVLVNINMKDSFRIQRIKENMLDNYFSEKDYDHFVQDAADVDSIINTDWDTLERNATQSEEYYRKYHGHRGYDRQKYLDARFKDHLAWVKKWDVGERMDCNRGRYTVNIATNADAEVVDKYTSEIAKMTKLEDDMNKKLEECIRFEVSVIPPLQKEVHGLMSSVLDEMRALAMTVKNYIKEALNVYDGFKKGSDAAPYCFMKKPWSLSSPRKKYAYKPTQWNPMDSGTKFQQLYGMEENALTEHGVDFVYYHGHKD